MSKTLLVAWREFRQRARSRGFLIGTIGTPLFLILMSVVTGWAAQPATDPLADLALPSVGGRPAQALGYVDQADLIRSVPEPVPPELFRAYPDVEAAEMALGQREIGAYYVIPADYRQTGRVQRVSLTLPTMAPGDTRWITWVLLANLFPDRNAVELARLRRPFNGATPHFVALSPGGETRPGGNPAMPFLVTFIVLVPLFTSGGYLLQSLAQEKSSRVLEILLVSLRPQQLLAGKLAGLGGLALVQYAGWVGLALLALLLSGGSAAQVLAGTNLSAGKLLLVGPYMVGGFILYAALMAGIGALAPDPHNSRAWVFMLTLPMLIPLYLWAAIVSAPHSLLAITLSLVPFSAPVAMVLRLASTTVPAWQVTLSLLLLGLTGFGLVWLMARLFRAQTLLSGQALTLRRLVSALRAALA